MDPVTIVSLVGTVVGLTFKAGTIAKGLSELVEKYKTTEPTLRRIVTECHTLEAAASQIKVWIETSLAKRTKDDQHQMLPLRNALRDFDVLLEPLDTDVKAMLKKTKPSGDVLLKAKFSAIWNETKMTAHLNDVRWQANAVHLILTTTQLPVQESIKRMRSIADDVSSIRDGSIFSDSGSTINNVETEFDRLLMSTDAYRYALRGHSHQSGTRFKLDSAPIDTDDIATLIAKAKRRSTGTTAVHLACETGQIEIIQELIDAGFGILVKEKASGWTPLHFAAKHKHESVVALLLKHGAENVPALDGCTPLHLVAAEPDGKKIVNHLLQHLGQKTISEEDGSLSALHLGAREGQHELIKYLLGPCNKDALDNKGASPLHYACRYRHINCVRLLLDFGADCNAKAAIPDFIKGLISGLGIAIRNRDLNMVKLFLKHGASQDDVHSRMSGKVVRSAFHLTVLYGSIDILKLLDAPQDLRNQEFPLAVVSGKLGWMRAITLAACNSQDHADAIVMWLIDHGCDPNDTDSAGDNAMSAAAARNYTKLAHLFLGYHMDLNHQNSFGRTALHYATHFGALDMVKFLLENGASPNIKDEDGRTPLKIGVRKVDLGGNIITEETKKEIMSLLYSYMDKLKDGKS